jgi:amino acid adenylation domain-containing protein
MTTPSSRAVPKTIASLSRLNPQSPALIWGDRSLSFGELDGKANQFAAYLAGLGISGGETVAICMERSFDWIVAALGVMRAGAAYVPLDTTWPDSRLRFVLSDCGAKAFVARADLLTRLQVKAHGIDPRRDARMIDSARPRSPIPIEMDSLAYVIYTSGSSGVPKGVEITHANLNYLIQWHCSSFQVTQRDRASHVAGLGFDAAVWEIWPNLAAGATLCLADDEVRTSPDLLQRWLIRERVTVAFVPTVLAGQLIATKWPVETALRVFLTGGDVLHRNPMDELPFKVVNNYGPSECSVVATCGVLEAGSHDMPTIGRPIDDTCIYLLNEEGIPVGDGMVGEIYIGGPGVGNGYRNLPLLTTERFLPDPFSGRLGSRMYRTGDRGLRRRDGQLEFHGRLDRQVKIRGHRVELDEIGAVLGAHPKVDFAAVNTAPCECGENELVAYVMPAKATTVPSAIELQQYMRQKLPEHMIPPKFVFLDSIPLTSSGKVDFSRLVPPLGANHIRSEEAELPRNPIEEKLLVLVRDILKNKTVGMDDNFFLSGGHSLIGMQLVLHVQDLFGVNLTLLQLLNAQTVKQLAVVVESILVEDISSMSEEEAERRLSD